MNPVNFTVSRLPPGAGVGGLGRAVRAWRSSVDDISDALTTAMNEYEQQDDATSYAIESHR